jgi:hypothetical protein
MCGLAQYRRLSPITSIERAVLGGFGDVLDRNGGGRFEIGDGAGDSENAVVGARIDGSRLASMVLPLPEGPMMRMLWPPAAATSSERLDEERSLCSGVEEFADFEQRAHEVDVDTFDDGGLARVGGGDDEVLDLGGARGDGDGQHALHGAERAVEAELADEDEVREVFDREAAIGAEDAGGDGEIEAGAFFLEIGGCEVDGDARAGCRSRSS